jgi:hypothetical protein
MLRSRLPLLIAVAAVSLAAGCGGDDRPTAARAAALASGTYAGAVTGSDAYVAVVVDDSRAAAYLCDRGAVSAWFPARRHRDGTARLSSRTRAAQLALQPGGDGALAVHVRLPDGRRRTVALERVRGDAGLYRATARTRRGGVEAGWIVLPDGTRRGAANTFIQDGTSPAATIAAPQLDTATGTVKWAVEQAGPVRRLTSPGVVGSEVDL